MSEIREIEKKKLEVEFADPFAKRGEQKSYIDLIHDVEKLLHTNGYVPVKAQVKSIGTISKETMDLLNEKFNDLDKDVPEEVPEDVKKDFEDENFGDR